LTSRERVRKAINHEPPDRVPLDLGSTSVTGIHASTYAQLKEVLGVEMGVVRVVDPFQMLAEVEEPVRKRLGIDTYGVQLPSTIFGFKNENWKPWKLFDGTEVMVPGGFEWIVDHKGDILLYPKGDRKARPSGRMARDGYYFDAIVRQEKIDNERLDPKRWVDQSFSLYRDEDMQFLENTTRSIYEETDYSLVGNFCDGGLGDIGIVPGPNVKDPEGVRDPEEWYVSLKTRKDYISEIFGYQTELVLQNLKMYHEACGEKVDIIDISETDFGGQRGLLWSKEIFRELFKPRLEEINEWIHRNTNWKIFFHTCGSVVELMDDFVQIGVDILNPLQYSAEGMDLETIKGRYGDNMVFWGGGIDTQYILPFGSSEEINEEVMRNMKILAQGSGFVFSAVHNIQARIPVENVKALFDAFNHNRSL
jgi:hypothetical protein